MAYKDTCVFSYVEHQLIDAWYFKFLTAVCGTEKKFSVMLGSMWWLLGVWVSAASSLQSVHVVNLRGDFLQNICVLCLHLALPNSCCLGFAAPCV